MTLRLLKRTVLSLSLIVMTLSCSEHRDEKILLADSLSLACPDSAMAIMDSIGQTKDRLSRSERMYYELIRAKVQNRAYVDFTTDSVMLEVADYYDHHGTANERMLAHYLLGCTYRDLKEAPMSLQCYYDAVEAADTTSSDCDYQTLMSIWGQIATMLDYQSMPIEEMKALEQYQRCALICNDTMNYITGLVHTAGPYQLLGDTAHILSVTDSAVYLYKKHGYDALAAQSYFSAIFVYLDQQDYEKAGELLDIYRQESGLFDEYGNIAKGRESYYGGKAMYYKGIGQLDSAEYYYKKLPDSKKMEKYVGLADMFEQKGNVDSTILYSNLYRRSINDFVTNLHAQSMRQVQGMYDYSRNQKLAIQKEQESLRYKYTVYSVLLIAIIALFALFRIFKGINDRKTARIASLASQYSDSLKHIEDIRDELLLVKTDKDRFVEMRQQEIDRLERQLAEYHKQVREMTVSDHLNALLKSAIVATFKAMGNGTRNASESDWRTLCQTIELYLPNFYSDVIQNGNLTDQEIRTCILVLIDIGNIETSNILGTSPSRISTAKASSNRKLFGDDSARTLRRNIVRKIHK